MEGFAPLPGRKASGRLLHGQRRMPRAAASSGKSTLRPSPRFNSMAVKDGRLLEGQSGRGPFDRFEMPIERGSKAS